MRTGAIVRTDTTTTIIVLLLLQLLYYYYYFALTIVNAPNIPAMHTKRDQ